MPSRRADHLLLGFLEGVSWKVLDEYPEIIADLIRKRTGVYALYKQKHLYYVGLASNLMGRIKHHLRDRHANLWDRFSVYITQRDEHVKQLESLLLRISKPAGNRVKGGFGGSANLYRRLAKAMSAADADRRALMLGGRAARQRRRAKTADARGTLVLVGLVERRLPLRGEYKGKTYRATLRRDGYISYKGGLYESPSAAARRIIKGPANGWMFWHYKEAARNWPPLAELRR
ncbi:MAG: hypothetical protein ACJ8NR_01485 [Sulfurifustis sp.]